MACQIWEPLCLTHPQWHSEWYISQLGKSCLLQVTAMFTWQSINLVALWYNWSSPVRLVSMAMIHVSRHLSASDWSWENDTSQRTLYGVGMTLGYLCYITKIDISSKYLRWMLRKIAHFHLLSYMLSLQTAPLSKSFKKNRRSDTQLHILVNSLSVQLRLIMGE